MAFALLIFTSVAYSSISLPNKVIHSEMAKKRADTLMSISLQDLNVDEYKMKKFRGTTLLPEIIESISVFVLRVHRLSPII